jgi:general secretion pathway protein J
MTARVQKGFTLLELLVVMTLLSIIMTGLVYAMRTMGQAESRIDFRLEQLDNLRATQTFLHQTLRRASALTLNADGASGKTVIPFLATADSLTWVGILPARANLGGRYFFRLAVENSENKSALVIRFAPWQPDLIYKDWDKAEARVLLQDIRRFNVLAQGLPKAGADPKVAWPVGWQDGWPVVDSLPEQIWLKLEDARGELSEWIFSVRALPQGDNSFNRVVVGGGAIR